MVYGVKNAKSLSRKEIDEALEDLKFPTTEDFDFPQILSANYYTAPQVPHQRKIRFPVRGVKRLFGEPKLGDKEKYKLSTFKKYRLKAESMPSREAELSFDKLEANLSELHEEAMAELYEAAVEEVGEPKNHILLATAKSVEAEPYRDFERDIEEIVKERWRYLVMQFGGVFLTEIRPSKCFIEDKTEIRSNKIFIEKKTLADELIIYNEKKDEYGLNLKSLKKYLRANNKGNTQMIQIHFSDIMFNPKIKDYDIFSITSGDIKKANIFLDLAEFLSEYNKGKETIIPVHLPYYEKWCEQWGTEKRVFEFGGTFVEHKEQAVWNARNALIYLKGKLSKGIKLALETGNGIHESKDKDFAYGLIYEPHYLKFLTSGREDFVSICEDVGHLNLDIAETNWKTYLTEEISEFHVSGNNGKEDEHTIATPQTLKNYDEIMSFLKFYSGNICAEIGKGKLTANEFLQGVKNLAYTLFSEPTEHDFENLRKIENYVKITHNSEIAQKNLNQERYKKYKEYTENAK